MKELVLIRSQVSTITDHNFFITIGDSESNYTDEQIANIIKGANFFRTKEKIEAFVDRCNQTMNGLSDRVKQTESEWQNLSSQALHAKPGSPPSDFWVTKNDLDSIVSYNEKVEKYNNQLEFYNKIADKASMAKERHEDAVERYNEKKADLEEQIHIKSEELIPALDKDILSFLGKMEQLAYDSIHNKQHMFEGFMFIFMAKKAYVFIYDRINNTTEQRSASDIFKKLENELDLLFSNHKNDVKIGLTNIATYLHLCMKENENILKLIEDDLIKLPYNECQQNENQVSELINFIIETKFDFEKIICPIELSSVESKAKERKLEFESKSNKISELI